MKKTLKTLLAGAAIAMMPIMASAATLSGIIEEGGPSGNYNGLTADHTFNDFSNGTGDPLLNIGGDFTIWGSVTHVSPTQYKDAFTIDFGTGQCTLDFTWKNMLTTDLDFEVQF